MSGEREIRVTVDIQAPPETIWPMVADPARMGEWSPEATGVRWKDGATGPSVGATFKGKNRNGWHRWSADGTITTFDVNRVVEWDITRWGFKAGRWGYQIEPLPDGASRVTETFQDHRNALARFPLSGFLVTGEKDRLAVIKSGMESTLAKIKATAEAKSRS